MNDEAAMIRQHPLPNCFSPELLMISKGDGVWLEDVAGRKYLDFTGGIAVNALGYGREDLAEIASRQMKKLIHISNLYITEPVLELARKMIARGVREEQGLRGAEGAGTEQDANGVGGQFQAVQFLNSGSEANETALKYARLYALRRKGEGCHKLLCFSGSFHGRTMGALSVTPNAKYQTPFLPLIPGVEEVQYDDAAGLERVLDRSFAGVIVEVIQGEGGLAAMSGEFAAALNRLCRRHDVILIADEVQTGLSRTGSFYASAGIGLEPDMITLAKPLAAGLPLSAVLIPEKINSLIHVGDHGTTFGGGPVTTAVASRVWDMLSNPQFIDQIRDRGRYLAEKLASLAGKYPFLGGVRGRGLLLGVEVLQERLPGSGDCAEAMPALLAAFRKEGLLILRSGQNILRIAPPLIISTEEIDTGITVMARVFDRIESGELKLAT
ncbi:MAG: aspartate aminotransferase family protein [Spirochaetales bacterium]|nr:aspartate aminotransferase family protein [Spirochaetales bacterium]